MIFYSEHTSEHNPSFSQRFAILDSTPLIFSDFFFSAKNSKWPISVVMVQRGELADTINGDVNLLRERCSIPRHEKFKKLVILLLTLTIPESKSSFSSCREPREQNSSDFFFLRIFEAICGEQCVVDIQSKTKYSQVSLLDSGKITIMVVCSRNMAWLTKFCQTSHIPREDHNRYFTLSDFRLYLQQCASYFPSPNRCYYFRVLLTVLVRLQFSS